MSMRSEDYTADNICKAMNLSGFIEDQWKQSEQPTLRTILTPSFHPELCLTLTKETGGDMLSAVALTEKFWIKGLGAYIPAECEQMKIEASAFDAVIASFRSAIVNFDTNQHCVCIDGMGSESCLVSSTDFERIKVHISADNSVNVFVGNLLDLAWNHCHRPRIRNALAAAACYLGVKYPLQEGPHQQPPLKLAIIGTPEAKQDYFEMLKRNKPDQNR